LICQQLRGKSFKNIDGSGKIVVKFFYDDMSFL
jgi:hypothetical protein